MKQCRAWLAVLSLAIWGCGNAVSMEYTPGMVNTGTVVVGAGQSETLHIKSPGDDPATQSGAISSDNNTASLTITAETGLLSPTLKLTGVNTAYTGTVNFQSGILEVGAAENLFGRMSNFKFGGTHSGIAGLQSASSAMQTAINAFVAAPTDANRHAMDDAKAAHAAAVTAAHQSGALPTLAITDGQSVTWAGNGGIEQRLVVDAGMAGAILLGAGSESIFSNYDADNRNGGAIFVNDDASLSLLGGKNGGRYQFYKNTTREGGALSNYGTVTLSAADFTQNSAYFGGALSSWGIMTVSGSTFTENSAITYSGAIYNELGTLALADSVFTKNVSSKDGGAIGNDGQMTVSNSTFSQNTGNESGGAIENTRTMVVSGSVFTDNTATQNNGGAISNEIDGDATISNSLFTGNTAHLAGGAIHNTDKLTVIDSILINNSTVASSGIGGAVYLESDPVAILKATTNGTLLFSGNYDSTGANSLGFGFKSDTDISSLTVEAEAGGVVDMRDPMRGVFYARVDNTIAIQKTQDGIWKLGGNTHFPTASNTNKTTFTVEDGTLYLYREGEVANGQNGDVAAGVIGIAGSQSSFTLRSNGTLAVGGGSVSNGIYITDNGLSGGSRQGTVSIDGYSTLAFDLGHAVSGTPMLNMEAALFNIGSAINIDLLSVSGSATNQVLLQKNVMNSTGTFVSAFAPQITVRGENIGASRAGALGISLSTTADSVTLNQPNPFVNQVSTRTGGSGNWNTHDTGWSGTSPLNQFFHGDIVNFTQTGDYTLALNPNGDGTVLVAGMYVSGGDGDTSHAFTGLGITADASGGTSFDTADPASNNAATGKLVLGASASEITPNHASFATQAFRGVVDLTGTTSNSFRGGVDLYSGELRISSANQLGLDGSLKTSNGGTLNFMADRSGFTATFWDKVLFGTVTIADIDAERANGTLGVLRITGDVYLDGSGSDAGRLVVDGNKAGAIHVEANSGLSFQNNNSGFNSGGALDVRSGAIVTMTADSSGKGYEFTGNTTTNMGGAISNVGILRLSDAAFSGNSALNGGAIDNYGILTFSNAVFNENSATLNGGAIYSYGSTNLFDTEFKGNTATQGGAIFVARGDLVISSSAAGQTHFSGNQASGAANSIYASPDGSATITIDAEGLVDMRDPMASLTGEMNTSSLGIRKTGSGDWKLGGNNRLAIGSYTSSATTFSVDEGTLYLYRQDEVENASETSNNGMVTTGVIDIAGANSVFSLGDGATLSLGGIGHRIAVSNGTITLDSGSVLAFDMTDATTSTTSLTLSATTLDGSAIGSGAIRVTDSTLPTTAGETYTLVDAGSANATTNTGDLYVNGATVAHQVGRSALEFGLAVDATRQRLQIKAIDASQTTTLTWTNNAATGIWNTEDRNWLGDIDGVAITQFKSGDATIFAANSTPESITVASTGVTAGNMTVRGAYNFTGGAITAGNVSVEAGGSLGLVAGANSAMSAYGVDFNTTGSLNITGYTPGSADPFTNPVSVQTVITTTNGVTNFNPIVTVAGQSNVDFLAASAIVDGPDVKVQTGLRWYSTDPTRQAHGTFTIADGQTFTLGAVLADNSASTNIAFGWDGNSLTKAGGGTLVLAAANTYTGDTTVATGVLRLDHADAVAYSDVTVAADATLAASQSSTVGSLDFSDGAILSIATGDILTASGTVTLNGDLTVNLSSYATGTYTLLAGASILGFDPANFLTEFGGVTPPSDRVTISYLQGMSGPNETIDLDLRITNQAVAWKGGSGTWTDAKWDGSSDSRFYTGDSVTFASGTGSVAVDAAGVGVAGMVVAGGSYTFSGGAIASTTNTTLTGFTESLAVNGGSATFMNDIAFANGISVASGGGLYGSATMTGGVSIASGGSFGATAGQTLQVDSLAMASGSTFAVADAASLVDVIGSADIADGTTFTFGSGFADGDVRTILTAAGIIGWTGAAEFESGFLRYTVESVNSDTELQVTVEQFRHLLALGLTPNQAAVVSGLMDWNGGQNDLHTAILALGSDEEARRALSSLNGQVHANLPSSLRRYSQGYWNLLEGPVLSMRESAEAEASRLASTGGAAYASINPRLGSARRPLLWFSGGALYSRSRSDYDTARDRLTGSDFKVGGEFSLCDWNLGLAFRYGDTELKVRDRSSHADIDNYQLGLYAMRQVRFGPGLLRLTLGTSGGYHDIESRRGVAFGQVNQHLRADYHAWSLNGLAEAAYRMEVTPRLAVEPYLSLGWDSVWTDSFTESGGNAALRAGREHQGNFSTTLGTRLAYRLSDRVSVDGRAGWRHTYGSVRPHSGMVFAAAPSRYSFNAIGTRLARDEFVGGVGACVDLNSRASLRVDYDIEAGNGGFGHRGTLSVGVGF